MPDVQQNLDPSATSSPVPDNRRERLRFSDFTFSRSRGGQVVAEVELEWAPGVKYRGRADGQSSPMGDLRVAADAAIHALKTFAKGELDFELIGIKTVRAFDAN
ncbi:MAG TPA: hypothetical protein VFO66_15280, partial [Gemmatimonadaceae bacterium]|nr:hypothetical protein [Gemmatimonadaceae bacterium]